jgi:uncharacterized membrane protein
MADFKEEFDKIMDTPDTTGEYDTQDINDNKVFAILACFGILFWLPLVAAPKSKFGRFWANQGLILLIFSIVCNIISKILSNIPVVGFIISTIIGIVELAYLVLGIIYAAQGKTKELPLIGGLFKAFR